MIGRFLLLMTALSICCENKSVSSKRSKPSDQIEEWETYITSNATAEEGGEVGDDNSWVVVPKDALSGNGIIRMARISAGELAQKIDEVVINGIAAPAISFQIRNEDGSEAIGVDQIKRPIEISQLISGIAAEDIGAVLAYQDANGAWVTERIDQSNVLVEIDFGGLGIHKATVKLMRTSGLVMFGKFSNLDSLATANSARQISVSSATLKGNELIVNGANLDLTTGISIGNAAVNAAKDSESSSADRAVFRFSSAAELILGNIYSFVFLVAYGDETSSVPISLKVEAADSLNISEKIKIGGGADSDLRLTVNGHDTNDAVGKNSKAAIGVVNTDYTSFNRRSELNFYLSSPTPPYLMAGIAGVYQSYKAADSVAGTPAGVGGALSLYTRHPDQAEALEHMRIHTDGRVQIGANALTQDKLTVTNGAINTSTVATMHNTAVGATSMWLFSSVRSSAPTSVTMGVGTDSQGGYMTTNTAHPLRLGTNGAPNVWILSDGKVGVGNSAPAYALDVTGQANLSECLRIATTQQVGNCNSDERFKLNIRPIRSALARINALKPVTYEFDRERFPERHFSSSRETGLIAQDVEKVFPELVSEDSQGYKSVRYGIELQMQAIAALNELSQKVERIEDRHKRELNQRDNLIQKIAAKLCQVDPTDEVCLQ